MTSTPDQQRQERKIETVETGVNREVVAGRDGAGEDVKGSEAGVYVNGEKVEGRFFDIKGKLCALGLSSDVSYFWFFIFVLLLSCHNHHQIKLSL